MSQVSRYAAFTTDPRGGNPAGVVLRADHLDEAQMQQIATEVGYSETAFVLREGRHAPDIGLRFFSPLAEVAFCGHATIATAVALTQHGDAGPYHFSTKAGLVVVSTDESQDGVRATLTSVPGHSHPLQPETLRETLSALRWQAEDLDPAYAPHVAFAGNNHVVLVTRTRERLAHLDYDFPTLQALCTREDWTTLQLVWPDGDHTFHSRNPFPAGGVVEDPATGAAAAALGAYLRSTGRVQRRTRVRLIQGVDMGRRSELEVTVAPDDPRIEVTGSAVRIPSDSTV